MALVEALPLSYLHVFPYSVRPGTERRGCRAESTSARSPRGARRLRELDTARRRAFREAMVGQVEDVLVLETRDRRSGDLTGLTGNYMEVSFAGPEHLRRRVARVRVTQAGEVSASGVLEEARAA